MRTKVISALVCVLFVSSFIAVVGATAQDTQKMTGTVMSVKADTGEVMVQDDAGQTKSLTAGPEIDLKSLKEGDKIVVESDANGMIKSLEISK